MNTHRAFIGATTEVGCWVRDENGVRDLDGRLLTVPVYAYGLTSPLLVLDATQERTGATESDPGLPGPVRFTVTQPASERYLAPGLYRFQILADAESVYGGLLQVL